MQLKSVKHVFVKVRLFKKLFACQVIYYANKATLNIWTFVTTAHKVYNNEDCHLINHLILWLVIFTETAIV